MLSRLIKTAINVSKVARKDMSMSKRSFVTNYKKGFKIGKEYSYNNNYSKLQTILEANKSGLKNIKITKNDYPAIGALLGTCTPIPGGTAIGYSLGKFCSKI